MTVVRLPRGKTPQQLGCGFEVELAWTDVVDKTCYIPRVHGHVDRWPT